MAQNGAGIEKIGQLARNLGRLGSVPSRAAAAAAPRIEALLRECFIRGTDPYGRPWAPLAARTLRKHGPPPMTDTGNMLDTLRVTPLPGAGIAITFNAYYIVFHIGGFKHAGSGSRVPARSPLPTGTFPRTWRIALEEAVRQSIVETVRGAA